VAQFHGHEASREAEDHFARVIRRKEAPEDDLLLYTFSGDVVAIDDVLIAKDLVKSRGEAKRLLEQGGVRLDGRKISNNIIEGQDGSILKVGKRRFVKLVRTQEGT